MVLVYVCINGNIIKGNKYIIISFLLQLSSREKTCTVLVYVCVGGGIISIDKYIIISFCYNRII